MNNTFYPLKRITYPSITRNRHQWAVSDISIAIIVLLLVSTYPTPINWPINPLFIVAPIALVVNRKLLLKGIGRTLSESSVLLIGGLWIGSTLFEFFLGTASMNDLARHVGWFTSFLVTTAYASHSNEKWKQVWQVVTVFLILTITWFGFELVFVEPWRSLRMGLFSGRDELQIDEYYLLRNATGLATSLASFGYQLSLAVPLFTVLALYSTRRLTQYFFGLLMLAAMALTVLSTQRSALAGAIAGIVSAILFFHKPRKSRFRIVLGILLGIIAVNGLVSLNIWQLPIGYQSIFQKYQNGNSDVEYRLAWQLEAINMIIRYPAGTLLSGVSWEIEGYSRAARLYPDMPKMAVAVHNGYLTRSLRYGIVYFILVITLIIRLLWLLIKIRRSYNHEHKWLDTSHITVVAGSISILFVQSLLHNGSILTVEGSCTIAVVLLISSSLLCKQEDKSVKGIKSSHIKRFSRHEPERVMQLTRSSERHS